MLKLFLGSQEEGKIQSATVLVRWCVDQETVEMLRRNRVKDPHVLLVVAPDGSEQDTSRYLAPLDQLMEYVQIHKPGKNIIFAAVVWTIEPGGNRYNLRHRIMKKRGGKGNSYEVNLVDWRNEKKPALHRKINSDVNFIDHWTEYDVIILPEAFAKEPPAREKQWVGLFQGIARDQCEYRRHWAFAYTLQPVLILTALIIRILTFAGMVVCRGIAAGFLFIIGMRGVDFGAIIDDGKELEEVWDGVRVRDSVFFGWAIRLWRRERSEEKLADFVPAYAKDDLLTPDGAAVAPDFASLPLRRRNFHLYYQNLKTRVCKPFAQ